QLYDHGAVTHRKGACCAGRDIHDARAVAERIGIPHYVLDYEARFKEAVIDRFAESYAAGETPVPCVECNRSIKFADLLGTARELGAQVLATGHYVVNRRLADGSRALYRAHDPDRDQSYFLFATTREQLDVLRFPLGGLPKARVRELAREFGLAIANKQDSQDICFVPSGHYADVIERLRPGSSAPGEIVDLCGTVLGHHDGIIHFTIGQRKGLGIAAREPLYVVRLEPGTRRIVVGPRAALATRGIHLHDANWIGEGLIARGAMTDTLDRATIEKAYARWAPVYDLVFGKVFERGRKASIAAAERVGGRILEVGVGTGISLPDYARSKTIVGIDISAPMLRRAAERVAEHGLHNVEA